MYDPVTVFIFSYNRGGHLKACIESALRHAGQFRIVVIDDASDDADTIAVLDALPAKVECVRRASDKSLRHGGLYHNMQAALDMAGSAPFILFVQDDVQFVRDCGEGDRAEIQRLCDMEPPSFANVTFLRQNTHEYLNLRYDAGDRCYYSTNQGIYTGRSYADVAAVNPARLRAVGWRFEEGEYANSRQADRDLGPMRYMVDPLLMNAPRPIAYRQGKRSRFIRLLESVYRYGVYSFVPLDRAGVDRLKARDPSVLPVAERFLRIREADIPKPWDYAIFESHRFIMPAYNFIQSPLSYTKYQIAKRLGSKAGRPVPDHPSAEERR